MATVGIQRPYTPSSPVSHLSTLADHLRGLGDPSEADIEAVARDVARECQKRSYPLKSLGGWARHHADAPAIKQVAHYARMHLGRVDDPLPLDRGRWLSAGAAAALWGVAQSVIRDMCRTQDGRRQLGWPIWLAGQWMIPEPAIHPDTRAAHMAQQPDAEPEAHRAHLPDWARE